MKFMTPAQILASSVILLATVLSSGGSTASEYEITATIENAGDGTGQISGAPSADSAWKFLEWRGRSCVGVNKGVNCVLSKVRKNENKEVTATFDNLRRFSSGSDNLLIPTPGVNFTPNIPPTFTSPINFQLPDFSTQVPQIELIDIRPPVIKVDPGKFCALCRPIVDFPIPSVITLPGAPSPTVIGAPESQIKFPSGELPGIEGDFIHSATDVDFIGINNIEVSESSALISGKPIGNISVPSLENKFDPLKLPISSGNQVPATSFPTYSIGGPLDDNLYYGPFLPDSVPGTFTDRAADAIRGGAETISNIVTNIWESIWK